MKQPLGTNDLRAMKGKEKIAMLTAYDYTSATLFDRAGVDMLLVGDSLGMVMLGRPDTVSVTLEDMISHPLCDWRGGEGHGCGRPPFYDI